MPPSELLDNLGNLVDGVKTADVTIMVKEEVFHAHSTGLSWKCMRSPVRNVFIELQLDRVTSGQRGTHTTTIWDMEPDVFRALLHYIYYTDSLPAACHG